MCVLRTETAALLARVLPAAYPCLAPPMSPHDVFASSTNTRVRMHARTHVRAQARNIYNSLAEQLEAPAAAAGGRGGPPRVEFAAALTALFKDMAVCLDVSGGSECALASPGCLGV